MKTRNLLVAGTLLWAFFLAIWNQSWAYSESCKWSFWSHAIAVPGDPEKCTCEKGYIRNYDKTKCVEATKERATRNCQRDFWIHATMWETLDDCICEKGYEWNTEGKECIKITADSAQDSCEKYFWPNAVANLESWNCKCAEGSIRNSSNNYCIKKFLVEGTILLSEERENAIAWLHENLNDNQKVQNILKTDTITRQESAYLLMQVINNVRKRDLDYETNEEIKDIHKADGDFQSLIKQAFQVGLFK